MNIEELQVKGSAIVTAIDDCPEIAGDFQPEASDVTLIVKCVGRRDAGKFFLLSVVC